MCVNKEMHMYLLLGLTDVNGVQGLMVENVTWTNTIFLQHVALQIEEYV